ncbi:branched-chain amino acid transporter permease [Mycolicibacterium iranicum]|uniref:Branched-chain amino acid ABC transporter n=1 Tax=Mycolicibacterium iranicum TaxID=912594 RepID=A0A178LU83_MYCIR|nr:AzlD domain-containing protein [Mycolicibacterium iranicum]OAN37693.1 branched-chain amino acid ABC transporter [Mycolicibacterium iranicum]
MPDNGYIALLVVVSAGITWALRALPFAVLVPLRDSVVVKYLSIHMPLGVMAILAIYTLTTVAGDTTSQLLWLVLAVGVTAGLHVWRGQALLSILVGTATYVTLMSLWG